MSEKEKAPQYDFYLGPLLAWLMVLVSVFRHSWFLLAVAAVVFYANETSQVIWRVKS